VLRDKAKIHHLSQVFQEVGSLGENLLIEKIAEKGTVGFALFGNFSMICRIARWRNKPPLTWSTSGFWG
jgi:hypothetical protein